MKKLDYLKLALNKSTLFNDKRWLVSLLAIMMPLDQSKDKEASIPYFLIKTLTGMSFVLPNDNGETTLEPIDDYKQNQPLFTVRDVIEADSTWAKNIKEKQTTQLGNLIVNAVGACFCFPEKMAFINGVINTKTLEEKIAPILVDDPEDGQFNPNEKGIYVSEMIKFNDQIHFLNNIAEIISVTATPKNIVAAPNMAAARKKILAEYGDSITDPVKLAEVESALQAVDDEYLKDDPSSKVFIKGKIKNIGRKKMYVIFGDEAGFEEKTKATPVTTSLDQGWDVDPAKYPNYINALRSGAYSRGAETIKGGVVSKTLLRAFGGFKVTPKDCGSKLGFTRVIKKGFLTNLVGRSIQVGSSWKVVEDIKEAGTYLGKSVTVRSPMYCKADGEWICSSCLTDYYKNSANSIPITVLEVGAVILGMFMAAMHGKVLSTVDVEIEELCS